MVKPCRRHLEFDVLALLAMVRAIKRAKAQILNNCLVFTRAPKGGDVTLLGIPKFQPFYSPEQAATESK